MFLYLMFVFLILLVVLFLNHIANNMKMDSSYIFLILICLLLMYFHIIYQIFLSGILLFILTRGA